MRKVFIAIAIFCSINSYAQRAKIQNDTAYYNNKRYALADTILLGYGSKSNKDFAFISIGSALTGVTDLERGWAKNEAVIDKIYSKGKNIYLRAKLTDKTVNAIGGNKLFIDLEGAVDNKELMQN